MVKFCDRSFFQIKTRKNFKDRKDRNPAISFNQSAVNLKSLLFSKSNQIPMPHSALISFIRNFENIFQNFSSATLATLASLSCICAPEANFDLPLTACSIFANSIKIRTISSGSFVSES